jgi:hypothetical protein
LSGHLVNLRFQFSTSHSEGQLIFATSTVTARAELWTNPLFQRKEFSL